MSTPPQDMGLYPPDLHQGVGLRPPLPLRLPRSPQGPQENHCLFQQEKVLRRKAKGQKLRLRLRLPDRGVHIHPPLAAPQELPTQQGRQHLGVTGLAAHPC